MPEENGPDHLDACGSASDQGCAHVNQPGQATLSYRVGTYQAFIRRMLAQLAEQQVSDGGDVGQRPLAKLTTRESADPIIALLDAWAISCDVLTFYQERIANEGFLRTATERRSTLELARAIGYELSPGVAASTHLAFIVEDAAGMPDRVAVSAGTQIQSIPTRYGQLPQTFETSEAFEARAAWNALKPACTERDVIKSGKRDLYLAGINTFLQPGDAIVIVGRERQDDAGSERWDLRLLQTVEIFPAEGYTRVTWARGLGHRIDGQLVTEPADDASAEVYVFRQRAALFGHNAPDWRTMPQGVKVAYMESTSLPEEWPGFALTGDISHLQLHLDGVYPKITENGWIVLAQPAFVELYRVQSVSQSACMNFTLTAKTTRVTLELGAENLNEFENHRRDTVVYCQAERLARAARPLTTPVQGNAITLDRQVDGLQSGQPLIVNGQSQVTDGETTSEVVRVANTETRNGRTTITLQSRLTKQYVCATATVFANVVPATHGETVEEILGSGDGARAHQQFQLRRPPLTYVPAPTARGTRSSLQLRVGGVLWQEVLALYGQDTTEQAYIVRIDDGGRPTIIFGDGNQGARLSSGMENVTATYRTGIGSAGLVEANSLTMFKTRPFGMRSVTNPLPAIHAADPEELENTRANAPLTVLTLDRIVSLEDFESFTRAFAGIGKAQSTKLWNGACALVHITVAGVNGSPVQPESVLYQNLHRAIDAARDPTGDVQVDTYERINFRLKASVKFNTRHLAETVEANIRTALVDSFSFNRRGFGQPVSVAEIVSVIHNVKGVVAVDLDALYSVTEQRILQQAFVSPAVRLRLVHAMSGALGILEALLGCDKILPFSPSPLASVLSAKTARREGDRIRPAQLVVIDARGIELTLQAVA